MKAQTLLHTVSASFILLTLLTWISACKASSHSPEQPPGQQSVLPTPEFGTVEVEPNVQVSPDDLTSDKPSDCPDLDSQLLRIVQASNPLDLTEQLQLKIKEDKVQVLLVLERADTGFLQDFDVEIGTQLGTKVQAFVPIDQLCPLANTDEVLAIRPPAQAVPQ